MKRIHFLAPLLLVLLILACRKETITTDEKVITQPPTGVTDTELSGVVRTGTGPLTNAQVEVYQGETLVGTVTTDAQGKFSTAGLSLQLGATITLYARKANYVSTAKRLQATQPKVKDLKINVMPVSEARFPIRDYLNPADDALIVVSGYVTDPTSAPAYAAVALLYNIRAIDGGFEADGASMLTDENGYYEALLPKDSVLYLNVLQPNFTQQFAHCQGGWLNAAETTLFSIFPADVVGPFTTDTQLPTLANAYRPQNVALISGTVVDCGDAPVSNGYVTLSVQSNSNGLSFDREIAADGTFGYSYELCTGAIDTLRVQAFDRTTGKSSLPLIYTNVAASVSLGNVSACQ